MLRTAFAAAAALALTACSPPAQEPAAPETAVGASAQQVQVTAPTAGAQVTSPLRVEGTAPGDWYFEAQFPAQLVGANGEVLSEAPALSQTDWMTEAPVAFVAEMAFTVTQDTPATLVLQEDMPGDQAEPREVRVPVVLTPGG